MSVDLSLWTWVLTVAGLLAVLSVDFVLVSRNPREPSLREASLWTAFYVSLAVLFGLGLLAVSGPRYGGEFFAGWITEYSLSVDNLFVFLLIMTRFAVPRQYQQKVLLVGVALALVMRAGFIAVGAGAITHFDWVFYLFGAFLVFTAYKLVTEDGEEDEFKENAALRTARRVLPTAREYHGASLSVRVDGRRLVTPMLIVIIAIGTTDLLFALDSIPAIFGLTKEPYLVFTTNAFALMGLRQLYFLVGGLLDRLIYLNKGLAVVLGFIGVKLVLETLHHDGVAWAPEVSIAGSLVVIVGTLAITTVASLVASRRASTSGGATSTAAADAVAEDSPTEDSLTEDEESAARGAGADVDDREAEPARRS
jgi:tellurite resistance protein TerC